MNGGTARRVLGTWGVSTTHSRSGFERALAFGAHGTYNLISRGLHGAVRSRGGSLVTLPRARAWLGPVSEAIARFEGAFGALRAYDKAVR